MLGWWAEAALLPGGPAVFAEQLAANRARMTRLQAQARQLVSELTEGSVGVLLLKGAHTAPAYWPEPGCRAMSDIDILIPLKQQAHAKTLWRILGT
jgi:hypothetical protein